ncbi:MAG: flagellar basal body P-ring protein FlgI [Candidatus Goldiibacteriota bacterium]|jgi:flagellar P-ring protein precursor FlgI
MIKKKLRIMIAAALALLICAAGVFGAEKMIRNVARFKGVRDNQITGFGLVVGLKGTGDRTTSVFTSQAIVNMLKRYGVADAASQMTTRNVAAVMVTANLEAFAKKGSKLDVVVSSMGDAQSLDGGVLLQTTMKGLDDNVYAVAQGPVSTGDSGSAMSSIVAMNKRATTGRVPNGGLVEKEVPVTIMDDRNNMFLILDIPDFTSADRVMYAINSQFWGKIAAADDAATVKIHVPFDFQNDVVSFAAAVEGLYVEIEEKSNKIVVNERTGTVVMGGDVTIDNVAVAHGNYNVNIAVSKQLSQPNPFVPGASAMEYEDSSIKVEGGGNQLVTMPEGANVQDLVNALNVLGASPKDIISIIQALKAANAIHADLEIM